MAAALTIAEPASGEFRHRRPDGTLGWLQAWSAPIRDPAGAMTGAVVGVADVGAEREAAEALRASELHFRALAQAVPQIVWAARPDGATDYVNPRFHEFTGLPPEAGFPGGGQALHAAGRAAAIEAWREALACGTSYAAEFRLRRADGAWGWFAARAGPARGAEDEILRWIGTATDVTDLI